MLCRGQLGPILTPSQAQPHNRCTFGLTDFSRDDMLATPPPPSPLHRRPNSATFADLFCQFVLGF